ncbi:MAG TPA: AMP-binding protein, partial [Pyrinomonadaceae bacterium]|nr:AMP-binding protein [Pyrinomonadaceae bacterium]
MASAASAKTEVEERPTSPTPSSVPALCLNAALRHAKEDALNYRTDGEWRRLSAESFVQRVRHIALGLASFGVKPGDRVALLSENRPEWSMADLAILSLGAVNVPIYTTQAVDQIRYILGDSGTRAIFISNRRLYHHAREALEGLEFLEKVIFFDSAAATGLERAVTLELLENSGREQNQIRPTAYEAYLQAIRSEDL